MSRDLHDDSWQGQPKFAAESAMPAVQAIQVLEWPTDPKREQRGNGDADVGVIRPVLLNDLF